MASRRGPDHAGRVSNAGFEKRVTVPAHIPNVRRPGEVQRPAEEHSAPTRRYPTASPKDLADARAVARYGEPGGWLGAMFYALHFWFRRRKLVKKLRKAKLEHERAEVTREKALLNLGEGLHKKNGQIDLGPVSHFVDKVDQSLMALETSGNGLRDRLKRDSLQKELADHYRQLAQTAVERGIARHDAQGWGKLQLADRAVKKTKRLAYLTELGMDLYDPMWVKRGALVFWCTLLFILAAGIVAMNTR